MTTLTLNIPEELLAALNLAGRERSMPEAAVAIELLKEALLKEDPSGGAAARWVDAWRGRLKGQETPSQDDPRVQQLLAKHLR